MAEIHHMLGLSLMNIHSQEQKCMPSDHSDSDEQDLAVCKFLSNSLLCML